MTRSHRCCTGWRWPYLAIAATDVLLLAVADHGGEHVRTVALAAVCLTALVVARQIHALRENGRLLRLSERQLRQLERYQEQLRHHGSHDDLTELANRSLFEQETRAALAAMGTADGRTLSLALIDLDDFKAINDRLGYRYAQGYHFSRPLTPIQVSGHLERTRTTLPV
jgi:hypothetical protein